MDKVMAWLFTDPVTAGGSKPEVFHFYLPWMIACALGLLIPLYYSVEARKRFFRRNALHRYLMDKFMGQVWPIALVGWALIGMRYSQASLFSWRAWRYAWALWAVIVAARWVFYLAAHYRRDMRAYRRQRTLEKYYPRPHAKRSTAKAGAR